MQRCLSTHFAHLKSPLFCYPNESQERQGKSCLQMWCLSCASQTLDSHASFSMCEWESGIAITHTCTAGTACSPRNHCIPRVCLKRSSTVLALVSYPRHAGLAAPALLLLAQLIRSRIVPCPSSLRARLSKDEIPEHKALQHWVVFLHLFHLDLCHTTHEVDCFMS